MGEQPFFLAVGILLCLTFPAMRRRSGLTCIPDQSLSRCHPSLDGDRDDTPDSSWYIHWDLPEPRTELAGKRTINSRPLVRAYLAACISFVDSQVGRVILDALQDSRVLQTIRLSCSGAIMAITWAKN